MRLLLDTLCPDRFTCALGMANDVEWLIRFFQILDLFISQSDVEGTFGVMQTSISDTAQKEMT